MAKLLMKTTDVYRVDTEEEAMAMIEDAKENQNEGSFVVTKSGYVMKTKKQKGEIVDAWYICSIEKTFE